MNMDRQEVMCSKLGEMLDMMTCLSIYKGSAEPAKRKMSYDEQIALR